MEVNVLPPPEVVALCHMCHERNVSIRAALNRANVVPLLVRYAAHRDVASAILKIVSVHRPSQVALGGCVDELALCGMNATRSVLAQIVEAMIHVAPTIRRWHPIDPSIYRSVFVMALHASMMRVKRASCLIDNIIHLKSAADNSHVSGPIESMKFGSVFDVSQHHVYFSVALYCPREMAQRIGESVVREFVTKPQLSSLLIVLAPHLPLASYTPSVLDVASTKHPLQRSAAITAIDRFARIDAEGRVVRSVVGNASLVDKLAQALDDANDDVHSSASNILLQCMVHDVLPRSIVGNLVRFFERSPFRFGFEVPETLEQARTIVTIGTVLGIPHAQLDVYKRHLSRLEEEHARKQRLIEVGLDGLATPDAFHCPVTREVMRDPVVASDGHTYERETLLSLIHNKQKSPLTRESLNPNICVPNINLRKRIREYSDDVCDAVKVVRTTVAADPLEALLTAIEDDE